MLPARLTAALLVIFSSCAWSQGLEIYPQSGKVGVVRSGSASGRAGVEVADIAAPEILASGESSSRRPEPAVARVGDIAPKKAFHVSAFSKVAIGFKVSTLGAGVELAVPLSRTLNLRGTVNYAGLGYSFDLDGINYYTEVNFRSGQLGIDWFPFHGGFHISPGVLVFKHNLSGVANVSPGKDFELDDSSYTNSVDDPVSGTAAVRFARHVAPALMFGFGNIIPRSGRHFSVPFEFGAAFTGAGQMNIQLAGTACTAPGCFNAASDPDVQTSLKSELKDLNDEVKKFQFYPIISLGLAYRF
jgi:hypothetical protein